MKTIKKTKASDGVILSPKLSSHLYRNLHHAIFSCKGLDKIIEVLRFKAVKSRKRLLFVFLKMSMMPPLNYVTYKLIEPGKNRGQLAKRKSQAQKTYS